MTAKQNSAVRTKRALSAHSVLGIAIAAVLYLICLSGTVSVFKDELGTLEQSTPRVLTLSSAAAMTAAAQGMATEPDSRHLYIQMPTSTHARALVQTDNVESYLEADGVIVGERTLPWQDFVIDLHYYLHLPHSFGMIIVAIFGVFLFAMSITGVFAHPKIFKDAFAFRRGRSKQISTVDLHNRLAVWTAPFHISNSLSGAMIGLASLTAVGIAAFDFDNQPVAVFEPIFGSEPDENLAPAPMARIDLALDWVASNVENADPVYVILHDPNSQGQYLQIMAQHHDRLIYAEKYNFDGDGNFLGTVGSLDGELGQQVADSVYRVHFGAFGGWPVKIAFGLFGTALLYIIASGMRLYFMKRSARGHPAYALKAIWDGVLWSAPALFIGVFAITRFGVADLLTLKAVFWAGMLAAILYNLIRMRADKTPLNDVDTHTQ